MEQETSSYTSRTGSTSKGPQTKDYELDKEEPVDFMDLASLSNQPPLLQGHVFKQSSRNRIGLILFKKRYFILYERVLIYYEHKSSFERDRHHGLRRAKKILLDDLHLSQPTEQTISHCFTLHAPHKLNNRQSYILATIDRRSKNIWKEMLQKLNPQLEPAISETDGHSKHLPPYIHKLRSLDRPSPILHTQSLSPDTLKIEELNNYHYFNYAQPRRGTWNCDRLHVFRDAPSQLTAKKESSEGDSSDSGSLQSETNTGSVQSLDNAPIKRSDSYHLAIDLVQ